MVVWLYAGDAKQAHECFQDAMDVDCFGSSEEALSADALFFAYKSRDVQSVKKVRLPPVKAGVFILNQKRNLIDRFVQTVHERSLSAQVHLSINVTTTAIVRVLPVAFLVTL